jgi:hypothetical protein
VALGAGAREHRFALLLDLVQFRIGIRKVIGRIALARTSTPGENSVCWNAARSSTG